MDSWTLPGDSEPELNDSDVTGTQAGDSYCVCGGGRGRRGEQKQLGWLVTESWEIWSWLSEPVM